MKICIYYSTRIVLTLYSLNIKEMKFMEQPAKISPFFVAAAAAAIEYKKNIKTKKNCKTKLLAHFIFLMRYRTSEKSIINCGDTFEMLSRHKKFHPLLSAFSFIFVDIVEIKERGDVFNETEIFQIGFHRHKRESEE